MPCSIAHLSLCLSGVAVTGLRSGRSGWSGWRHGGGGGAAPRAHLLPAQEHAGHRGAGPAQAAAALSHLHAAGWQRARGPAPLHSVQVQAPQRTANPSISQSINQSIQFYIALLYIPEVALQSPESSSHTHTVIPVVVSYLSSHSCPGAD